MFLTWLTTAANTSSYPTTENKNHESFNAFHNTYVHNCKNIRLFYIPQS